MKRLMLMFALMMASALAWALPSEAEIQAQVKAGQYEQAEKSMAEVVAAKPDSAKAHYVYAQILAHQRRFDEAAQQAAKARTLDPALHFTQPDKFKAFEALLQREQHPSAARPAASPGAALTPLPDSRPAPATAPPPAVPERGGVPGWVWGAGFAVLALVLWRAVSRGFRAPVNTAPAGAASMPMPMGGYGNVDPRYGAGNVDPRYGGVPAAPGSGLRTGLAAGAGVVGGLAAGMLIDEMLHRDRDTPHPGAASAASNTGLAGVEPGFFDREVQQDAADQLASRDIDFGSGNDWDSGGDAGSSSDDW